MNSTPANDDDIDLTKLYEGLNIFGRLHDLTARVDDLVAYMGGSSSPAVLEERNDLVRRIRLALREARTVQGDEEEIRWDLEGTSAIVEAGLCTLIQRAGDSGDIEVLKKKDMIMILLDFSLGLIGYVFVPSYGRG